MNFADDDDFEDHSPDPQLGYKDLLTELNARFQIDLDQIGTEGYPIWEARLKSGGFLWICDLDSGIYPRRQREKLEAAGTHIGWALVVHGADPNNPDEPDLNRYLASIRHATATAAELPGLVERVIQAVDDNGHYVIDCDGKENVKHGIEEF